MRCILTYRQSMRVQQITQSTSRNLAFTSARSGESASTGTRDTSVTASNWSRATLNTKTKHCLYHLIPEKYAKQWISSISSRLHLGQKHLNLTTGTISRSVVLKAQISRSVSPKNQQDNRLTKLSQILSMALRTSQTVSSDITPRDRDRYMASHTRSRMSSASTSIWLM